jgi:uncharacterized coiled-coil protein SlyX
MGLLTNLKLIALAAVVALIGWQYGRAAHFKKKVEKAQAVIAQQDRNIEALKKGVADRDGLITQYKRQVETLTETIEEHTKQVARIAAERDRLRSTLVKVQRLKDVQKWLNSMPPGLDEWLRKHWGQTDPGRPGAPGGKIKNTGDAPAALRAPSLQKQKRSARYARKVPGGGGYLQRTLAGDRTTNEVTQWLRVL